MFLDSPSTSERLRGHLIPQKEGPGLLEGAGVLLEGPGVLGPLGGAVVASLWGRLDREPRHQAHGRHSPFPCVEEPREGYTPAADFGRHVRWREPLNQLD